MRLSEKMKKKIKQIAIYVGAPLVIYLLFSVILGFKNIEFIKEGNFNIFLQNFVYMALIGFGVSLNVPSGRFDFSIGSVMVLSSIIGGNLALSMGLGSFGMVALFAICGAGLGAISGLLYVILRLPAMVTSLGVMLIFESFTFMVYKGKGLTLVGQDNMLYMASNTTNLFLIILVCFALIFVLNRYTKLGYNRRALMGEQKTSVNAGVKEKKTAVICYILSGILVAIAGIIPLYQAGTVAPKLGMGTIMVMFSGFLAMFIGLFLSRWGDLIIGVLIGAIISSMLTSFLAQMGFTIQQQSIINAVLLLLFLVFDQYFNSIKEYLTKHKKNSVVNN